MCLFGKLPALSQESGFSLRNAEGSATVMVQFGCTTMDVEHERRELLEAINNLKYLIEQTTDAAKLAEYSDQLNKFKSKLIALLA
jgi:myo-inositol-hexaphosphate 3-phosphohydrolase